MKVGLLTEKKSWIYPFVVDLKSKVQNQHGTECLVFTNSNEIKSCDIVFVLGYLKIIPLEILKLNKYNMVIHESDLPNGKGSSPMAWQILDGEKEITFTLFNADGNVDSGDIFLKKKLILDGRELYEEWRRKQAYLSEEMVLEVIQSFPNLNGYPQDKEGSFYRKRNHFDDELDVNKPFKDSIDKLRICDPNNFPSWFIYEGSKFKVTISKF
tara:strand:- start:2821 stop:3456 length:636 start_codon:yes stop_codon:yes gene_type:complete